MRRLIFLIVFLFVSQTAEAANPTITSFAIAENSGTVDVSWTVADTDGDLNKIEVWRAPDDVGAPRIWTVQAHAETISGSGDTGSDNDSPGDGVWWYGLRVSDLAGNHVDAIYSPDAKKIDLEVNTCTDADGDHYYSQSSGCENRPMFLGHNDCEDTHAFANIDRDEICSNSIDDDCDGSTDEAGCVTRVMYHVKAGGNNANSGLTDALAWETLAYAQSNVTANSALLLNRGDSWNETFTVAVNGLELNAYGTGDKPIIIGSEVVSGSWSLDSGNIYKIAYSGTVDNLHHNGSWMHISHEPDGVTGQFHRNDPADGYFQLKETGDDMTWSSSIVASGYLVAMAYEWRRDIYEVQSYSGGVIQLVEDRNNAGVNHFINNGIWPTPDYYWLVDTKEYLDTDTEWWSDGSYIYTYSASTPTGTWEAITAEFGISATDKDDLTITNINIKNSVNGIVLDNCLRFKLDSNEIERIGTQRYRGSPSGYVNMDVSHAIMIEAGSSTPEEGLIVRNHIHHILANGVDVYNYEYITAYDNIFEEMGTVETTESFEPYSGFLQVFTLTDSSGFGTKTHHAHIYNNYFGKLGGGAAQPVAYSTIEHNTVVDSCLHLNDIGSFYLSGTNNQSHDTVLEDNYILTTNSTALYNDSSASDISWLDNTVIGAMRCIHDHGGSRNIWDGNECIDFTSYGYFENYSAQEVQANTITVTNNVFQSDTGYKVYLRVNRADSSAIIPHQDWFAEFDNNTYSPDSSTSFYERLYNGTTNIEGFEDWRIRTSLDANSSVAIGFTFPFVTGSVVRPICFRSMLGTIH